MWYRNEDPAKEDSLGRKYYRARFDLTSFTDLLETLVATYDIFGPNLLTMSDANDKRLAGR